LLSVNLGTGDGFSKKFRGKSHSVGRRSASSGARSEARAAAFAMED
jgi:hypothetical protein